MANQDDLETLKIQETESNPNETSSFSETKVQENYEQIPLNYPHREQSHQHQHINRGMTKKQKALIIGFTVFMPINVVILENFWLTEPIRDNEFEYNFSLYSVYFLATLSMIAYYYAIMINNSPPKKPPPEIGLHYLPEIYQNTKLCESDCHQWKPIRSHHCRQCNSCSIRMDHHCPWTVNCVGAKNHKAFYLFCIYMGLGSIHYCYRSIYFFVNESNNGNLTNYSTLFFIYWILTCIILFPIAMMLVSLMIFHSCAAMTNVTTLENMSGTSTNCCNNSFNDQYFSRTTNLFDRGMIANYIGFLGNSYFLFWFPKKVIPDKDGTEFPMNPPLTYGEMIRETGKIEILVAEDYYEDKKKIMNEIFANCENEYKDKNLQIAGRNFEHFKKAENNIISN